MNAPAPSAEDPFLTNCHVGEDFVPCDPAELLPLVERLSRPDAPSQPEAFPRGTLLPDGRLDLCKQKVGPLGAKLVADAVRGSAHVRHILLGADGLGDAGAEAIAGLARDNPNLQTIFLGCNRIQAKGAKALAESLRQHPNITGLWLKRNPIGLEGAQAVAELLRRTRTLRTLDLVNTALGGAGVRRIAEVLAAENRTVERLYLCGNGITPADVPCLAELLRANPTLTHLYLSVNHLGDAGTRQIADALRENRTLRLLSLSSNGVGPAGAEALAEAVQNHPRLAGLELGYEPSTQVLGAEGNRIGDAGAAALARMLRSNQTVRSIDLFRNGVTDDGVRCFVEALEANRSLTELVLGKGIAHGLKRDLKRLLDRNRATAPPLPVDEAEDVLAIRSVYRTARARS